MPRCLQDFQLLVRDLVQVGDGALVFFGELVEPDVGVLGDQHQARHPILVLAEALVFRVVMAGKSQHGRSPAETARTGVADDLLLDKIDAAQDSHDEIFAQDGPPAFEQVLQLGLERMRERGATGQAVRRTAFRRQDSKPGLLRRRSAGRI